MPENKVIFDNKPETYARKLLTIIFIVSIMGIFFYLISFKVVVLIAVTVVFLVYVASYELSRNTFEGWQIYGEEIILLKNVFSGLITKSIKLDSISNITYYRGGRGGSAALIFRVGKEDVRCNVYKSIFELAGTLKFLQSKGIKIRLLSKDDEVQMYLDGKIPSVPMTNE
jgi:hypothetical protein